MGLIQGWEEGKYVMRLMEDIRLINDAMYHEGCVCLNNIMHLLAGYTKVYGRLINAMITADNSTRGGCCSWRSTVQG